MQILNSIPMYKVTMYALFSIVLVAFVESFFGILSYDFTHLILSYFLISFVGILSNFFLAKFFKLPFQYESTIITSLILFLILLPVENLQTGIAVALATFVSIASKYFLVVRNTHLFNPAAFGLFVVSMLAYFTDIFAISFWWVGSLYLLPVVLFASLIVVVKTRKTRMFAASIFAAVVGNILFAYFLQANFLELIYYTFISGPIIFLSGFMITEPHTIAKNDSQQIFYGAFIILLPVLFSIMNIWNMPPEFAILVGNILSFVTSYRQRFILKLKEIKKLNDDMFEYIFTSIDNKKFSFKPGEYMEWNLDHKNADSRSTRRYFTISSEPNIEEVAFATKFPKEKESSFKTALKNIQIGDIVYASQLGGDFTLPTKKNKNIIMIAGGIGITPFISQLRDLLNQKQKVKDGSSIALFYCVNSLADIVFIDVLKKAVEELGAKIIFVVGKNIPDSPLKIEDFTGTNQFVESGYMSKEILNKYTQNLHNEYYLSGPNMMVEMMRKILVENKYPNKSIHTDYFPGF
jgi:ferredoxin-NADP reductase